MKKSNEMLLVYKDKNGKTRVTIVRKMFYEEWEDVIVMVNY